MVLIRSMHEILGNLGFKYEKVFVFRTFILSIKPYTYALIPAASLYLRRVFEGFRVLPLDNSSQSSEPPLFAPRGVRFERIEGPDVVHPSL